MATKVVTLACDTPAAATQASGLCSLPPLGLGPLSTSAIVPPSLPVPVFHGWSTQHPLLSPPSLKDVASAVLLGLEARSPGRLRQGRGN